MTALVIARPKLWVPRFEPWRLLRPLRSLIAEGVLGAAYQQMQGGEGLERIAPAAGGNGNDSFTKLLLHGEGPDGSTTFTDSSSGAKSPTVNGDAQIDTSQFKFGSASMQFDGSGDYLIYADHADWQFSTGDMTIDVWIRINSTANNQAIAARMDGAFGGWSWNITSSAKLQLRSDSFNERMLSTATILTNTWYHVALVQIGGALKQFIDGTQDGSYAGTLQDASGESFRIANGRGFTPELNGRLDEFRVSKGIARWTGNFTPPTEAYG